MMVNINPNITVITLDVMGNFMGNRWGDSGNSVRLNFLGAPKSLQMVTAAMN